MQSWLRKQKGKVTGVAVLGFFFTRVIIELTVASSRYRIYHQTQDLFYEVVQTTAQKCCQTALHGKCFAAKKKVPIHFLSYY